MNETKIIVLSVHYKYPNLLLTDSTPGLAAEYDEREVPSPYLAEALETVPRRRISTIQSAAYESRSFMQVYCL